MLLSFLSVVPFLVVFCHVDGDFLLILSQNFVVTLFDRLGYFVNKEPFDCTLCLGPGLPNRSVTMSAFSC